MDQAVSMWFYQHISQVSFFNQIAKWLSLINEHGEMWLTFLVALCVYSCIKNKRFKPAIIIATLVLVVGWLFTDKLLKNIVCRPRPGTVIEEFRTLTASINYTYPNSYSFPSGHAVFAFGSASIIGLNYKKLMIPSYLLAVIIALSRIILGAHYLSDVLAGSAFGLLFGIGGYYLAKYLSPKLENKLYKEQK